MRCHDRRRQQPASLYQTSRPCSIIQFVERVISARENHKEVKEPTLYAGGWLLHNLQDASQEAFKPVTLAATLRPSTPGTQVPTNTPTAAPLASWEEAASEAVANDRAEATVRVEFAMSFQLFIPPPTLAPWFRWDLDTHTSYPCLFFFFDYSIHLPVYKYSHIPKEEWVQENCTEHPPTPNFGRKFPSSGCALGRFLPLHGPAELG